MFSVASTLVCLLVLISNSARALMMILNNDEAKCFDINQKRIGGVIDLKYSVTGATPEKTILLVSDRPSAVQIQLLLTLVAS